MKKSKLVLLVKIPAEKSQMIQIVFIWIQIYSKETNISKQLGRIATLQAIRRKFSNKYETLKIRIDKWIVYIQMRKMN